MPSLTALVRKYKDDMLSGYKISCSVVSSKVADGTPIEEGDLVASWTPSIGNVVVQNINVGDGDMRRHDLPSVINRLKLGDKFNYANGQPYGPRIEYEGHSAHKAPQGMVRVAIAEWQPIADGAFSGV